MATANNEFFEALSALEKERGLPEDYLIDKIKQPSSSPSRRTMSRG